MKIVCLGDSLTRGYGVPKNHCWVELLKLLLSVEIVNKGLNGDTTASMLARCYTDIIECKPTHAIIMGGTNDFLAGRACKSVLDNIYMIIDECETNNIKPIIAIQPPIISDLAKKFWAKEIDYNKVNYCIEIYRETMIKFALKNDILFKDFFDIFKIQMKHEGTALFVDGIHLSSIGHKLMADIFFQIQF